ncbi:MAG: NPCBM/NEW2 domain-containing protein [Patescibacteria group bacterium]|nr:NPCBM/NEW2 domain-containing protein [Patescibacteria group bacterium]
MQIFPFLLALLAGPAEPMTSWAVPAEGAPFQARLEAIDGDWGLVFHAEGGKRSLPAGELVRFGAPQEVLRGPVVVFADGGRLVADVTGIDKFNLRADSTVFGHLTLPLEQVAGIVFLLPADAQRQMLLFDRLLRAEGRADRVLLENGDELTGLIELLDRTQVRLDAQVGPIKTDRRNVAAVVFNPMLRRPARPKGLHAWLGLSDGSLFPATKVALGHQELAVTAAVGQLGGGLPEDLVYLQPMGGRLVYLSDLEPETYRHVPYLEVSWPYLRDRNVTGGPPRCGHRQYLKGLGMHTAARITYRLDGGYSRFQSEVGVDDSTEGRGSVRFRVFVDGRERYTGTPIRGGEPPVAIDLDVSGADRLDLVVDFADRAHVLDHANWLDARLLLPRGR